MNKRIIAIGRRLQRDRMPGIANSESIRIETIRGLRTAQERVFGKRENGVRTNGAIEQK